MIDPYKMVFINLVLAIIVGIGILIFYYIYPKKKINPLALLLILSLLPIISILRPGSYESGDFTIHVYRNMSFFTALQEGQFMPSWSRDLNATYGYPTFLIEAPLGDYLPALFHFLGFTFMDSMKILLAATFVFSGIAMYLWAKEEFGKTPALTAAIFYLYAPFHLVDMHFRVHPGDMLVYVFFPLLLYSTVKLVKKPTITFFTLTALSTALMVLSHPIALVAFSFTFLYVIFVVWRDHYKRTHLFTTLFGMFFGLLLSAFYWIPIVLESKYILTSLYPTIITFQDPSEYFYSPWRFGLLFQGPQGELSFLLGYIQWILIGIALYFVIKDHLKTKDKKTMIFFLTIFLLLFIMLMPFTKPLWLVLPLFKNLEFSYRILILAPLITAVIAAIVIKKVDRKWFTIVICCIAILSTILNWSHRRVIPGITDAHLQAELPFSTAKIEGGPAATPVWVNPKEPWMSEIPKSRLEIISGSAKVEEGYRSSIRHEYKVSVTSSAYIKENTYYYPGWTLLVDKKQQKINYTNKKYPGIITFTLDKGVHNVELIFSDTPVRYFAKIISGVSLFCLITALLFYKTKRKSKLTK